MGWETIGFQFGKIGDGVGGAVTVTPIGTPETNKSAFLAVFAAGSLGQIFPVLAAPLIRKRTSSAYLRSTLDSMSMFGAADFFFYATKDLLISRFDSKNSLKGDWQQFSEISGIPLYVISVVSLVWTGVLINYQASMVESELQQSDNAVLPTQFDLPRSIYVLDVAFAIF